MAEYLGKDSLQVHHRFKTLNEKTFVYSTDPKGRSYMDRNSDIISDTPVEEPIEYVPYTNADGTKGHLKCYSADGKQIEPPIRWDGRTVYDSTGSVVSGRRQFDVSKLPTRIHHASIYDEGKFDGEYFLKEKVLEAWNAGTIEELLEGWTK